MVLVVTKKRKLVKNVASTLKRNIKKPTIPKIKKKRTSTFKKVAGAVTYRKALSSNLTRTFSGQQRPSTQQRVKAGPGRPAGPASYKHRDPQTGQPIPATLYYKRIKEVRRQAQQAAQLRDLKAIQELGKRGIPPQQAQQIVDSKQLQSVGVQPQQFQQQQAQQQFTPEQLRQMQLQQMQQQQYQQQAQQNGQVIPQGTRVWKYRRGVVGEEGGLNGRVQKVYGVPQSFWN